MEIIHTKASQIRLVHHNELPLLQIGSGQNLQKLAKQFNFNQAEGLQDPSTGNLSAFQFRFGIHQSDDGTEIAINKFVLEERRMVVELEGDSKFVDEFFENVRSYLSDLSNIREESYLFPVVIAYESEIIARLGFSVYRLISPVFLEFLQSTVAAKASNELATAKIVPANITFSVDYLVKDWTLSENRITLSRKEFSVHPAIGYSIEEQVFFSKAPFNTDIHLSLLENLEEKFPG